MTTTVSRTAAERAAPAGRSEPARRPQPVRRIDRRPGLPVGALSSARCSWSSPRSASSLRTPTRRAIPRRSCRRRSDGSPSGEMLIACRPRARADRPAGVRRRRALSSRPRTSPAARLAPVAEGELVQASSGARSASRRTAGTEVAITLPRRTWPPAGSRSATESMSSRRPSRHEHGRRRGVAGDRSRLAATATVLGAEGDVEVVR